jgi:hypothetical protein
MMTYLGLFPNASWLAFQTGTQSPIGFVSLNLSSLKLLASFLANGPFRAFRWRSLASPGVTAWLFRLPLTKADARTAAVLFDEFNAGSA